MRCNPLDLTGKKFLITGAASGIGRETSILLSNLGADLILLDFNKDGLLSTSALCDTRVEILEIDLTDTELLKTKLLEAVKSFGKLDGFAHIAGISCIIPLKALTEKTCDKTYKINTYAAIELSKLFINRRVCNQREDSRSSIVLVSSVYGLVGSPANVAYAMSKSAIIGITKALAMEFAPKNIKVNCVAPGFVKTEMMDRARGSFDESYLETIDKMHPLGLGNSIDIAYSIAFLLSDMSNWMTGSILNIDGGFTAQ